MHLLRYPLGLHNRDAVRREEPQLHHHEFRRSVWRPIRLRHHFRLRPRHRIGQRQRHQPRESMEHLRRPIQGQQIFVLHTRSTCDDYARPNHPSSRHGRPANRHRHAHRHHHAHRQHRHPQPEQPASHAAAVHAERWFPATRRHHHFSSRRHELHRSCTLLRRFHVCPQRLVSCHRDGQSGTQQDLCRHHYFQPNHRCYHELECHVLHLRQLLHPAFQRNQCQRKRLRDQRNPAIWLPDGNRHTERHLQRLHQPSRWRQLRTERRRLHRRSTHLPSRRPAQHRGILRRRPQLHRKQQLRRARRPHRHQSRDHHQPKPRHRERPGRPPRLRDCHCWHASFSSP